MLEIIILVLCGRHIASIAKRKNRSAVGYVILMVLGWYGGAFAGAILGVIVAEASGIRGDDNMGFLIVGLLLGAVSGLGFAYLVVCSVSPLPKRRGADDDDYDDYDDRPRRRRDYDEDEYDRPRSRRRDEDYDDDRPRRRRRDDDD
jgi:MFS family permease